MIHDHDHAVSTLDNYITSDGELYKSHRKPYETDLILAMAEGRYDRERAIQKFKSLARIAAVRVSKEEGIPRRAFTDAALDEVAKDFAIHFETEAALGNYAHLLPKKYQTATKPPAKRARR